MKKKFSIMGLLLFAMAILFGASADISMAMADTFLSPDGKQTPGPSETPDVNTTLTSTPTSATVVNNSDIAAREMDKIIAKHRPWKFTGTTDMYNKARRVSVTKYEIEHPVSAATLMDCTLGNAFTSNGSTIDVYTTAQAGQIVGSISVDDLRMFAPDTTVLVQGVDGYVQDKSNTAKGLLVLKVTDRTANKCTLKPLNGYWNSGSSSYIVPNIPAGTTLSIMSAACSESQLEVAPENYIPTTKTVYLQKKIVNIVMTDEFEKQIKEVPFFTQDVEDNAMYNFRRKAERTLWAGVASKANEFVSNKMGSEHVYTSEGMLWQLLNKFAISGNAITFEDLIDICRIQFGKDSVSDEAEGYCGDGFLARLLKIDFQKTGDVTLLTQRDTFGIMISKFQCTFGTLNFKKTPALNDLGYYDCCAIIDMANATRYVKVDDHSMTVDLKKSGADGEVREAKRRIFIEADAMCLRGYNSMLVGPADKVFNFKSVNNNLGNIGVLDDADKNLDPDTDESSSVFYNGTAPVDGQLYYLAVNDSFSGFAAGTLVQFKVTDKGGAWDKYSGSITI